jgi:hypothetical protein
VIGIDCTGEHIRIIKEIGNYFSNLIFLGFVFTDAPFIYVIVGAIVVIIVW